MQAVILAGGKGARLKPYTTIFPKPLMPIGDYPILEVMIKQLRYYGIREILIAVGHLKELIQAFFHDGSSWGVNITYSFEDKPLGTAGPLKLIENLQEHFLLMNGDVLTNLDFRDFFKYHKKNDAVCTIAMYSKPVNVDLGVLKLDEKNIIRDYIEKPTLNYNVSMGIYAFKKSVLDFIPDDMYFDFPHLIQALIANNQKVQGYPFEGHWLDIGRHDDYELAIKTFEEHKSEFMHE